MLNFEQAAVTAWFETLRPATITEWPPPIRAIETEAGMPGRLTGLGAKLNIAASADLHTLARALRTDALLTPMRDVLAQLGAARVLRLLHFLAETGTEDCHAITAGFLQADTPSGEALRASVDAVIRQTVLRRMFAPERIAALKHACHATLVETA